MAEENGHGPPKDIPAVDLWAKLQAMPRPSVVVDFPRKTEDGEPVGKVRIWVLTQEEQMICSSAAEKFAKEKVKDGKKEDLGYETIYANASVVEILFRACRQEQDISRAFFPTPSQIRQFLTADECGRLFEYYLSVQLELGPIVARMEESELDAWIDRLVEGGLGASPFVLLSPETQKVLAHSMACLIVKLRKDRSSVGSPQGDTPSSVGDDLDEVDLDPPLEVSP